MKHHPDGTCRRHVFFEGRCINCPMTEWAFRAIKAERMRSYNKTRTKGRAG